MYIKGDRDERCDGGGRHGDAGQPAEATGRAVAGGRRTDGGERRPAAPAEPDAAARGAAPPWADDDRRGGRPARHQPAGGDADIVAAGGDGPDRDEPARARSAAL